MLANLISLALVGTVSAQLTINPLSTKDRLNRTIIPSVEFRDANALDVLLSLCAASTSQSPNPAPPIDLILTNSALEIQQYAYELDDNNHIQLPPINLTFVRIQLFNLIDAVSTQLNITYTIDDIGVLFFTKDGKQLIRRRKVEQGH